MFGMINFKSIANKLCQTVLIFYLGYNQFTIMKKRNNKFNQNQDEKIIEVYNAQEDQRLSIY